MAHLDKALNNITNRFNLCKGLVMPFNQVAALKARIEELELVESRAKVMEDALNDIKNWNDDLRFEYDCIGTRAAIGLGEIV